MKHFLPYIILFVLGALTLAFLFDTPTDIEETRSASEEQTEAPAGTRTVQLFYYDIEKDKDSEGNVLCSQDGLVPVLREIRTRTPIEETLRLLLAGELTNDERASGITTEYPLPGVSLASLALSSDGTLRIALTDPEHKLTGGSCRTAILAGQIARTARQFPEVTNVIFLPEDLFQP